VIARGLLAIALLATLPCAGCSRAHVDGESPWIAEAERRHALADARLQASDPSGAREALLGIVDARVPADAPSDDRRGVLQDTYFRLAEIDLRRGDARAALASADRGLALGRGGDLFVANLLVVRGGANEALGDGAAAAEDYHEALVINDRLLADALHEPDARGGTR
jgi:tetratricopeptide (TPR) repeat protein